MVNSKTEQRFDFKILVKLNKASKEFFQALTEVYGEEFVSRAHVLMARKIL